MTEDEKKELEEKRKTAPLYGYCFHVFGADQMIVYQGIVKHRVDPTHYMVTLFDWITGSQSVSYIVPLSEMVTASFEQPEGAWQFYANAEDMTIWHDHHSENARRYREEELARRHNEVAHTQAGDA